ncbi:hypothetical protein IFR05_014464, partial [Cadophora sp. M221]
MANTTGVTSRFGTDNQEARPGSAAIPPRQERKVNLLSTTALAASALAPTLPTGPLNITREWIDVSGDLGLQFTIQNSGSSAIEIGSLGFPAEFNSIFTNRAATDMARLTSLSDPYIGMHAGQIRVGPTSGSGPALVVTPLGDTPMEAYRNLAEVYYDDTAYGSQVFEGFYEWQVLSKAWAEKEWLGGLLKLGLRFSVVKNGARDFDLTVKGTGTPVAQGVPGYIIPRGSAADLFLQASAPVSSTAVKPAGALSLVSTGNGRYTVTPSESAWGLAQLTISYADGKVQTIHYYVTKPGTTAVANLGLFLTTSQWFTDTSDPFGRAPSVMTYDYETRSIVKQESRAWVASLSDEAGAGSFLAACIKQAVQPNTEEITKLESFIDGVLWKTIQTSDFAVRKSIFFYQPGAIAGHTYDSSMDWTSWTSWNRASAYATDRAYDYVHVTAACWGLYRAGRAYPSLIKSNNWNWYLNQAYRLMGETVFGEILADLIREGLSTQAQTLTTAMRSRATQWNSEAVPFGSEMVWDSTGQEGVYYWSKYFGYSSTVTKTVNSVYGGKLRRIERQIHRYGSGLNALVLLGAFRSNPSDSYLLRFGYGGVSGPVSNINQDGFAAASFHSWPDTLKWDGISGDYGPNFIGLALGGGTYVAQDSAVGLIAYGGVLTNLGTSVIVQTTDPVRRRVFLGPLGVLISIDAGIIESFSYVPSTGAISVQLTLQSSLRQTEPSSVGTRITLMCAIRADTGSTLAAGMSSLTELT